MQTTGFAAYAPDAPLAPWSFERRDLRADDVALEILFSGVCHSDLHTCRGDWGPTYNPIVPGHEIVGRVIATGSAVTAHKEGDLVAVGCFVDSCGHCDNCEKDLEQYCRNGFTGTYGGRDRVTGDPTQGGYAKHIVVKDHFVLRMPEGLDPSKAAPLLCAGITTWSPLRQWNVSAGTRVGVIGLGGLGHMAVKLAAALGAEVSVFSRTVGKEADAAALGAGKVVISTDAAQMKAAAGGFDLIIDTVPVKHDLNPYLPLLDVDGTLVIVGQVGPMEEAVTVPLIMGRRRIAGSLVGGIAETQEMLDFCAEKGVLPEVEMIAMAEINEAWDRMERSDVRYRFVIDMATLEG
ncbi:NAD(P)-dependent alcohol dehydrogenase [Novosphingobium flavum]|uniref:NAD(P)-dependent alcohol dehydrogenase n=1 Tax=Novosphingobium flavum TaxID=1778672 RepID=A0A7X1FND2_9SPHN|nr:NAD(P)-dependent alcohol dehydrogenase [Novosphingobium flavum]MBC2663966.1 NAD(P)-dependent alcohol dehydrogenase [Novosphingobium flavum]